MLNRLSPISDTPDLTTSQPTTEKGSSDAKPPAVAPESEPFLKQFPPAAVNESGIETVTKDFIVPTLNGYLLNITVSEKTWLKVLVDDQEAMEYALNTGDRLDLEAAESINLLIGNAGGVQLTLNDKPYPVPGKSGQVVNVVIP
jgi:cytoskeleton protein RodZ